MPPIVAELLSEGITRLKSAGINDPETSTRVILQHLLKKSPSELQLACKTNVSDDISRLFSEMIAKRCTHFPLQYLIGEVEFYNVKLRVDQRVLIPRPETEIIVENLIDILKSKDAPRLLDIGTGSGNIAIALAANIEKIHITAVDVDSGALDIAKGNACLNEVSEKIEFACDDCLHNRFYATLDKYDAVVSNPPYIAEGELSTLQPEVNLYEPKIALVAEKDPLIFFKTIIAKFKSILKPTGVMCFEVGIGQASKVADIFQSEHRDIEIKIVKDLSGIDRVVIGSLP